MNIKTLTAPTIHAALKEARRLHGDDVMLVESTPPTGDQPARVTVMIDEASAQPAATPAARPAPARPVPQPAPAAPAMAFGYAGARPRGTEQGAAASAQVSDAAGVLTMALGDEDDPARLTPQASLPSRTGRRGSVGRDRLFTRPTHGEAPPPERSSTEQLVEAQMERLHARLDALEQRFAPAVIGASHGWAAHPCFAELLGHGLQPATVAALFDAVAARGFAPATDPDELRWALAQELRRRLAPTAPGQTVGTQVVVGASGAGKTSLLLRLARHPDFFGRRQATVLVIEPEDDGDLTYQSPVELYRRFDLPVQSVRTTAEMYRALSRARRFDQIFVDTPSLPSDEAEARRALLRIKKMLEPMVPLQVVLTVHAGRALDGYDADALGRLPLAPSAVALTHLDATPGWGRAADWLVQAGFPVPYVGVGPRVSDGLVSYSPAWFVETMLGL